MLDTLLYKRNPTRLGECLVEIIAVGRKRDLEGLCKTLKRRGVNVAMTEAPSLRRLEALFKQTILIECDILKQDT